MLWTLRNTSITAITEIKKRIVDPLFFCTTSSVLHYDIGIGTSSNLAKNRCPQCDKKLNLTLWKRHFVAICKL